MIVGYGIDIMTTSRIRKVIECFGDRFLDRIYTRNERAVCDARSGSIERFTAFWAVKEAAMKALGTGFRQGVVWRDIEVCHEPSGKPYLQLHGRSREIADALGTNNIVISMSHLDNIVVGSVVFENT